MRREKKEKFFLHKKEEKRLKKYTYTLEKKKIFKEESRLPLHKTNGRNPLARPSESGARADALPEPESVADVGDKM